MQVSLLSGSLITALLWAFRAMSEGGDKGRRAGRDVQTRGEGCVYETSDTTGGAGGGRVEGRRGTEGGTSHTGITMCGGGGAAFLFK